MSHFRSKLFPFLFIISAQFTSANPEEAYQRPMKRLLNDNQVMAKVTKISMTSDLNEGDSGTFKEFGISIGHLYFHNKLVMKKHKGALLDTELVLNLDINNVKVKVIELDEYLGVGPDVLIALPFNYFNPNDLYLETLVNIDQESRVVTGRFKSDKITLTVGTSKELTGQDLFLRMNKDILGCRLQNSIYNLSSLKMENVEKCRNFKSAVYILSQAGYNEGEIREIVYELEPNAREERVGHIIGGIDWYQRNFDK